MKDLGESSYILGMKIYRDRSKRMLGISQSTYIETVLKKFSMENYDDNQTFISCSAKISFSIRRMLSTYKIRNATARPFAHL